MLPVAGMSGISLQFCAWGWHRQLPRKETKGDVGTPALSQHRCPSACQSLVLPVARWR